MRVHISTKASWYNTKLHFDDDEKYISLCNYICTHATYVLCQLKSMKYILHSTSRRTIRIKDTISMGAENNFIHNFLALKNKIIVAFIHRNI